MLIIVVIAPKPYHKLFGASDWLRSYVASTGVICVLGDRCWPTLRAIALAAKCKCPEGRLHYICKHMVKVISRMQGNTGAKIIQALAPELTQACKA